MKFSILACLLIGLALTACKPGIDVKVDVSTNDDDSYEFLLKEVPESVPGIIEAIQDLNAGDAVVFTGRVGGVKDPMMKDFAAFVVADETLVFCDEMADPGHCPTPWDACCEDDDKVAAARVFVQFVDESGAPRTVNLEESIGLAANQNVVVQGQLSPESTPGNRIILAKGVAILQ